MTSLSVSFQGIEVAKNLELTPGRIRTAVKRTIRQYVNEAHKELGAKIPKQANITVRGFKKVRAKKSKPARRKIRGTVWMGRNPVTAKRAGKPRGFDGYAKAGKYLFNNAFVVTFKSGYSGVFKRTGKGRLAIKEQTIALPQAERQVASVFNRKQANLASKLQTNIQQAIEKANRAAVRR